MSFAHECTIDGDMFVVHHGTLSKGTKQTTKYGDFTFVTVKRNSFKSNTSQKFVNSRVVGIYFEINLICLLLIAPA